MIELDETVAGIWILQITPTQDWLAAIREIEPNQKYELTYRFRYYNDDKVFDSDDEKNWYRGTLTGTRAYVLGTFREVAKNMESIAVGNLCELLNDKGIEDLKRRLFDAPGIYARQERS
jgi:sigma54-dependent transcription regulator